MDILIVKLYNSYYIPLAFFTAGVSSAKSDICKFKLVKYKTKIEIVFYYLLQWRPHKIYTTT